MNDVESHLSLTLSDIVGDPRLRLYLRAVRNWHGYIRFLGLPDRRDNPDVLIDRLFVEPLLSRRHVLPDENPKDWIGDTETIFDAMKHNRPIVLLGDPGSGKSTLLNYLVWRLARPTDRAWTEQIAKWLLPVPMVLRELDLHGVTDFHGLLRSFLNHSMSSALRGGDYLALMLSKGSAMILLDGVDEIADPRARKNLRKAVFDGFNRYPKCSWILSSRIVGYDEVRFDMDNVDREFHEEDPEFAVSSPGLIEESDPIFDMKEAEQAVNVRLQRSSSKVLRRGPIVRYLAPFDDRRINLFAQNWYHIREAARTRSTDSATHLVRAIHENNAILCLARIPNLLTLMALIHRVEATLPHGRALLYDRIAEAYLESIDRFRGIYSSAYNLPQKKRWLARIGYELQRRRSSSSTGIKNGMDLLVTSEQVLSWLNDEMKKGGSSEQMSAADFLSFVGRRSGLFLPRGQGQYAFVHLSFQEYFAAVALENAVTSLSWARHQKTPSGVSEVLIRKWARQSLWRDTFSFLFELLVSKEEWHSNLLSTVFGQNFSNLWSAKSPSPMEEPSLAELASTLAINQRSGLVGQKRDAAIDAAIVNVLVRHRVIEKNHRQLRVRYRRRPVTQRVFQKVLNDESVSSSRVIGVIAQQARRIGVRSISLANMRIGAPESLRKLSKIQSLDLNSTQISDLQPLSSLNCLRRLFLEGSQVSDLTPLSGLVELRTLDLDRTRILDVARLHRLTKLRSLYLSGTEIDDLGSVRHLKNLRRLHFNETRVCDISAVAHLHQITSLSLAYTSVADISPVSDLSNLSHLNLDRTLVSDLDPLRDLQHLIRIDADGTKVSDIRVLSQFRQLRVLFLCDASVSDLAPLSGLSNLRSLFLRGTQVADLRPLADCTSLVRLSLEETAINDISPLAGLKKLEHLDLQGTQISDVEPLFDVHSLKFLVLRGVDISNETVVDLEHRLPRCSILR